MKENLFGFIGSGNMGGALATAVSKKYSGSSLLISDSDTKKAEDLARSISATTSSNENIAKKCKYIFLAVKPQVMDKVLASIKTELKNRTDRFVLVTMAAGLSIDKIREFAGGDYPVIRIMPNTPVFVGEGMILFTVKNVVEDEINGFLDALEHAGKLDKIDEKLIDAAGSLSGCGPAFVYLFAEALADGAVECGVPRDKALKYASQTILGAAKMLIETNEHPGKLKDAVCSPGGTTIAGVHALENGAFRSTSMDAVKSAYERTLELK